METKKRIEKLSQSITVKALTVGFLTLILLIPNAMIQDLIWERKDRSQETIEKINEKWSHAQTLCAPILSVPYTSSYLRENGKVEYEYHTLHITPETLDINTELFPEERHYGIYKTILYKSSIEIKGQFGIPDLKNYNNSVFQWEKAYIRLGFSDLRGVANNIEFILDGNPYTAVVSSSNDHLLGKELTVNLENAISVKPENPLSYQCSINLNGSSNINFIPVGKSTTAHVSGVWKAPGYIGNFSPEHTLSESGFDANWNILRFNRSIPEEWTDAGVASFDDSSFGINLVDTVDHYQQSTRSGKYSLMFIALTFIVFFFVEILTKSRIHPIQYLLVGMALILFYTLLLSISEQLSFDKAYAIASVATIGLATLYTNSIFKNRKHTGILTFTLCLLYMFLYVILQLEDIALLIGSIGLFIILAIIMYCSQKITWYKDEEPQEGKESC